MIMMMFLKYKDIAIIEPYLYLNNLTSWVAYPESSKYCKLGALIFNHEVKTNFSSSKNTIFASVRYWLSRFVLVLNI